MQISRLIDGIKARFLRVIYRSSTSYPYLSGDLFASMADLIIDSTLLQSKSTTLSMLEKSHIVFCPSHLLDMLLNLIESDTEIRVLIVGNGDKNFSKLHPSMKKIAKYSFIQNSLISDGQMIFTLPIGLENKRYGVNGMIKFKSSSLKTSRAPILVGPFSPTASSRGELTKNTFVDFDEFEVLEERLSLARYSEELHSHRFVLCPEGNGVDTHRLWETLYSGSIPVVIKNSWSSSLLEFGFPIIQTDSWFPKDIQEAIRTSPFEKCIPKEVPQLWAPYWELKFAQLLND